VERAQRWQIRANGVINGRCAHEFPRAVARPAIGIDDYRASAGKVLQQARAHVLHHLSHGSSIIVSGHSNHNVHFANVNQLAYELIRKYGVIGQRTEPLEFRSKKSECRINVLSTSDL
jgi:hypothetical protein